MENHIIIRKQKSYSVNKKVKLEKVLGSTVATNSYLSTDHSGNIAYTAGCVVVLYNSKRGKQSHLFNISKKTLTCLSYSKDGKFLVTGESGHQPAVRVWNISEETQVAEFNGHSFGVGCVAFSPNLKYIVSIGTQHDMMVNVWDWKAMVKVASNKIASKISDVAFSEDGSVFVTVGNRHVKFWYLDASKSKIKNETAPLQGRNGILGQHKNNVFCGVAFGKGTKNGSSYIISESGLLTEFNEQRMLVKWLQFKSEHANCISLGDKYIFVGFSGGVCRIFCPISLIHLASVPFPHPLGIDVTASVFMSGSVGQTFADVIALCYSDTTNLLTCVYCDHTVYIWDTMDVKKIGKIRSFLFHSGPIWGIDVYPKSDGCLPAGSFATCSNDRTIRIWQLSSHSDQTTPPRKKKKVPTATLR